LWTAQADSQYRIREYTPAGTLVQTIAVPYPPGGTRPSFASVLDVATHPDGSVSVYDGQFDPYLSTLQPATNVWTHYQLAGWNTNGNTHFGGLAAFGNYAYATDTDLGTTPTDETDGVVRFDVTTGAATRFGQRGTDGAFESTLDVAVDADGFIYDWGSTSGESRRIRVFDPATLSLVRTITLRDAAGTTTYDPADIAVGAGGKIYGAGAGGGIARFSADGVFEKAMTAAFDYCDIDVTLDGRLAASSTNGEVIVSTTDLDSFTSFDLGANQVHVGFVTVPEPSGAAAIGLFTLAAAAAGRRRRSHSSK
jgi:MYXO-CTERM domain-containing protein